MQDYTFIPLPFELERLIHTHNFCIFFPLFSSHLISLLLLGLRIILYNEIAKG